MTIIISHICYSISKSECIIDNEAKFCILSLVKIILIFNKMALIFIEVLIIFTFSRFEFKNALQFIWSAIPEKAIDNAVKDYRKQLQTCVLANGGHFEHLM